MTKIVIISQDEVNTEIDIDMEEFFNFAQCLVSGTKIEIPQNYFNDNGATVIIK